MPPCRPGTRWQDPWFSRGLHRPLPLGIATGPVAPGTPRSSFTRSSTTRSRLTRAVAARGLVDLGNHSHTPPIGSGNRCRAATRVCCRPAVDSRAPHYHSARRHGDLPPDSLLRYQPPARPGTTHYYKTTHSSSRSAGARDRNAWRSSSRANCESAELRRTTASASGPRMGTGRVTDPAGGQGRGTQYD